MVRTRIIKIGNSQGIRIPKPLLEHAGLGEQVELEVQNNRIVIRPVERPRQGWGDAFHGMAEQGDDRMLDEDLTGQTRWDEEEWEW